MIQVSFYNHNFINQWNNFLNDSKGQTFMFSRNFMDYHSDRFIDRSILVFDDNDLVAIMPASLNTDKISITSHSGLTFGSFIVKEKLRTYKTIEYFYFVLKFLQENYIESLIFKQIPSFYSSISTDELDYVFFILKAELYRLDVAYAINYEKIIPYQERRIRSIKKAIKNNIRIVEENDFTNFWNDILTPNLKERFGVLPVHSLDEITKLSNSNIRSIHQFNAYYNDKIMAGTTLFETPHVIHAQYISASEEGRKNGSLDYLFDYLIKKYSSSKKYFDFGIVNEDSGRKINLGLLDWKEGFGARAFVHRFYKISTINLKKIEKLLNI